MEMHVQGAPLLCRVQKMVEQTLIDVGIGNTPEMPTRETCGAWLMLRMEVIALQEAKKRLQNRALGEAGNPEGRGKRAHKGKVICMTRPSA